MAAPDPSAELMRMINWYQVSQALHVAAALGVADQLKDGQKSCDVVARACGAHPPSLYRLLRALAASNQEKVHRSLRMGRMLGPIGCSTLKNRLFSTAR